MCINPLSSSLNEQSVHESSSEHFQLDDRGADVVVSDEDSNSNADFWSAVHAGSDADVVDDDDDGIAFTKEQIKNIIVCWLRKVDERMMVSNSFVRYEIK